jgi:integrase
VEQRQADRIETTAAAKARLGHSDSTTARRAHADLALFNLAIDSKLRGCDVVSLKFEDVAPYGYAIDRATVRQSKTGSPVRFEITEQTRQAIEAPGHFLFHSRRGTGRWLSTRQYARLLSEWLASIGLDPSSSVPTRCGAQRRP